MATYCQTCGTRLNGEAYCPKCQRPTSGKGAKPQVSTPKIPSRDPQRRDRQRPEPQPPTPPPPVPTPATEVGSRFQSVGLVLGAFLAGFAAMVFAPIKGAARQGTTLSIYAAGAVLGSILFGILGGKAKGGKFISVWLLIWAAISCVLGACVL